MITEFLIALKRFVKGKSLAHNPKMLVIDTNCLCNNSCYFCWRHQKPEELKSINKKYGSDPFISFDIYKKIIDDAIKYPSITWLALCGPMGEPMMHNRLVDMCEYAYKKNHFKKISVNTNGLAIDKHDISRLLNSVQDFSISVDSIEPETYGKIHGSSEFLPKVIENIKKCIEYKKQHGAVSVITVRFTENELNMGQFPEFEKFFKDLGVDEINYTKVHSFAGVKEELTDRKKAAHCCQPNNAINFTFKGDLTTCCINWQMAPVFGNIKDSSLAELWMNEGMKNWLKNRLDTAPCNSCNGLGFETQKTGLANDR